MKTTLPFVALLCLQLNLLQAQVWTTVEMPAALYSSAFATYGNKLYIVGGLTANAVNPDAASKFIHIYDAVTGEWESIPYWHPRHGMQGLAISDKLMFAGGAVWWNGSVYVGTTDTVDVYDGLTDTWSIERLSAPRRWVTASVVGGKAYFAGGRTPEGELSDRLDIYDPATNEWTTGTIPEAENFQSGAAGDKLLLWSYANCHILDTQTGGWETKTFPFSRGFVRSVVATPDEVWFIGGSDLLDTIDIYNIAVGTWRSENLALTRYNQLACYLNGKIIIASGGDGSVVNSIVETFDTETGEWLDLTELSAGRHWFTNGNLQAPVIGHQAFFPGGLLDATFDNPTATMDIYTDTTGTLSSLFTPILQNVSIQAFPSPFSETLQVQVDFEKPASGTLEVYDLAGRQVFLENIDHQQVWDTTIAAQGWAPGAYLLKVRTRDGVAVRKVIKV